MKKFLKSTSWVLIGLVFLWILYSNIELEMLTSMGYILADTIFLIAFISILYFYELLTIKTTTDSHGHAKTTSIVDDNRHALRLVVGIITVLHVIIANYMITKVGISLELIPSILTTLLWIRYFRLWNREVNSNKIGIIMSQVANKVLREEREGPIVLVPFNERTTINEKGDEHIEDISDKLIPRTLSIKLRTKEGKAYTGVFTFWVKWTVDRSKEIREYAGGQEGLLNEVDKYVESEAQKIAGTKTCRETIDNLGLIITETQDAVGKIVGNADEREPITIAEKTFIMKRENDEEIAQYLYSEAISKLIDEKMISNPGMTREEATHQVNLEQKLGTESTLKTTGPGTVIASTALGGK